MALAVVLAMLASYVLSRTLVPTLSRFLFEGNHDSGHATKNQEGGKPRGIGARFNVTRERAFERLQSFYGSILEVVLHTGCSPSSSSDWFAVSRACSFSLSNRFFPAVDVGLMKLHFRAPIGTRIEDTEKMLMRVEARIRRLSLTARIDTINDLQGCPRRTTWPLSTDNVGDMDAEVLIALKPQQPSHFGLHAA